MDDQFDKLRELLAELNYPSVYLYKFIIKKDADKLLAIKKCFDESAEIETKPSKNGNYISVSIKEMMLNSEDIIERYKRVGEIDDVIKL